MLVLVLVLVTVLVLVLMVLVLVLLASDYSPRTLPSHPPRRGGRKQCNAQCHHQSWWQRQRGPRQRGLGGEAARGARRAYPARLAWRRRETSAVWSVSCRVGWGGVAWVWRSSVEWMDCIGLEWNDLDWRGFDWIRVEYEGTTFTGRGGTQAGRWASTACARGACVYLAPPLRPTDSPQP